MLKEVLLLDLHAGLQELAPIEAESIGWLPLGVGACLHVGDPDGLVIDVVGVAVVGMAGVNVVWVVG